MREHAAHEASRDGSIGIGKQGVKVVQKRPQPVPLTAVLFNKLDQLPLDGVFVVVNLGWLRCDDCCPRDENKIGTEAKPESRRQCRIGAKWS